MRIRFFSTVALAAVASFGAAVLLTGCGSTGTEAIKGSKRFYYTHVNRPATLDLASPSSLSEADSRLSSRLMNVDVQLTSLERALGAMSKVPDASAAANLGKRFPWISSLIVLTADGQIRASMPSTLMKELDFKPLLQPGPQAKPRDLRAAVQDSPLGPEIMLGRPFLAGEELQTLLVVTFDMRGLMAFASSPDDMTVRTPELVLWSGSQNSSPALSGVKWADLLRSRSYGTESDGGSKVVWLTRYLADVPLIFTSPAGK